MHGSGDAFAALETLAPADFVGLASRSVLDLARKLNEDKGFSPSVLLQALSALEAQLVTSIASEPDPPALGLRFCVREIQRARHERERAALQREIDRLQSSGASQSPEMDALLTRLGELGRVIPGSRVIGGVTLSIEEKYDEVRQLINVGKEKGYLLYDEVNEMLPSEITSAEDLDELFNAFGSAGIEVVDSDKAYRGDKDFDRDGSGDEPELDLTPGALDKTNDPVRMYLREMGTVPLLTREGEVAIAKRIERGKLAVIKSISRTPTIAKRILITGDQLRAGERTIRELVIFSDEEITDEVIQERAEEVLGQIEDVRKARVGFVKLAEKLEETPKKDKKKYRRARWKALRGRIEVSRLIRRIEFTETIKRRLIDEVKDAVDAVSKVQREVEGFDRQLNPKTKTKTAEAEGRGAQAPAQEGEGYPHARQADDRRPGGDARASAPHDRSHSAR